MEIKELALLVKEMRDVQKTFFREARKGNESSKRTAFELSKKLESEIDQLINNLLHPVNCSQQKLF